MNYQPTYLGEISLDEDTLEHYGVKGMKWGKRKKARTKQSKKLSNHAKYFKSRRIDFDQNGDLTVMERKGRLQRGWPYGNTVDYRIVSGGSDHQVGVYERNKKIRKGSTHSERKRSRRTD